MHDQEHANLNGEIKMTGELKNFTAESAHLKDQYLKAFLLIEVDHKREIIYINEEVKC